MNGPRASEKKHFSRLSLLSARAMLVSVAWLCLSLFLLALPGLANAQTSVTNVATITPPATVANSNPSASCTSGVCSAADTDSVVTSADLGVTKTASVSTGTVGTTFTYVIAFGNTGPSTAQNVTLTDSLTAAGLTLIRATTSV
ncbi:MAG: DUF11 domain-containing protein, partial [Ramlibacter sp.]|nr:DUF11 domain-containing protein [Ramlibacter sp.]